MTDRVMERLLHASDTALGAGTRYVVLTLLLRRSLTRSERTETVRTRNVDSALLHLLTLFSRLTYRYALRDKSTQGSAMARGH